MTRSILVGELRTGRRITRVPVTGAGWSVGLNGKGSVDATLKLSDPKVASRVGLIAALDPARCYMAALEGDHVIEAGPIWAHAYDDATKSLTIKAGGLASIFDHRLVMKVLAAAENPATGSLAWSELSLGTQAKRLISTAISHVGGSLPIALPADEAGTHTRTYPGFELARLSDRLGQLRGVIGGPDIAFTPRLTEDRLSVEWEMRTGTSADPLLHQVGSDSTNGAADHVWDARAPKSGVMGFDVARDGGGLAFRAFATGAGAAEGMLIRTVEDMTLTTVGYPLLESVSDHNTVSIPATLDAHAADDLGASVRPWMTWTLDVLADKAPILGAFRCGDWAKVYVPPEHPYLRHFLPAGFYRARIIGISGGLDNRIKVDLQPQMGAR